MGNINLQGLEAQLRAFASNGRCVSGRHWKVASGGYDLWWELYYDEVPVIDCEASGEYKDYKQLGLLRNICLDYDDYMKVCQKIKKVYSYVIIEDF